MTSVAQDRCLSLARCTRASNFLSCCTHCDVLFENNVLLQRRSAAIVEMERLQVRCAWPWSHTREAMPHTKTSAAKAKARTLVDLASATERCQSLMPFPSKPVCNQGLKERGDSQQQADLIFVTQPLTQALPQWVCHKQAVRWIPGGTHSILKTAQALYHGPHMAALLKQCFSQRV